jgi:hypothetical protein
MEISPTDFQRARLLDFGLLQTESGIIKNIDHIEVPYAAGRLIILIRHLMNRKPADISLLRAQKINAAVDLASAPADNLFLNLVHNVSNHKFITQRASSRTWPDWQPPGNIQSAT